MIACRDVSFSYPASGPVDGECLTEGALKHITCTIEDGSFVLLCGASGCGCCAVVLNGFILRQLEKGVYRRVLFAATGAMMSTTSVQQGESIPGIAHVVELERVDG